MASPILDEQCELALLTISWLLFLLWWEMWLHAIAHVSGGARQASFGFIRDGAFPRSLSPNATGTIRRRVLPAVPPLRSGCEPR